MLFDAESARMQQVNLFHLSIKTKPTLFRIQEVLNITTTLQDQLLDLKISLEQQESRKMIWEQFFSRFLLFVQKIEFQSFDISEKDTSFTNTNKKEEDTF